MALLTMNHEPETRLVDTFQFEQDMAAKRDRFGGGTSLPLNSDGYEEKQTRLREERHQEWLQQQERQRLLEMQRPANHQKAPRLLTQPPGFQTDYNVYSEKARPTEKKAYQDHMNQGRSLTPIGGLNIGSYDRQQKAQAVQKKKEYREMLDQQTREQLYLRARQQPDIPLINRNTQSQYLASKPPSGPGYRPRDEPPLGPGFGPRDEPPLGSKYRTREELPPGPGYRPRDEPPLGSKYRTREELPPGPGYRPRDEPPLGPEFAPRDEPPLGSKYRTREELPPGPGYRSRDEPPLGPGFGPRDEPPPMPGYRPRDEAFKSDSLPDRPSFGQKSLLGDSRGQMVNGGERASRSPHPPRSPERLYKPDWLTSNEPVKLSETDTPLADEQQQKEKTRQLQAKPTEIVKSPYYSSENYEIYQRELQKKQGEDYKEYLMKKSERPHRDWNVDQNGILELRGDDAVQSKQRELRAERQKDYKNYISQQKSWRPHNTVRENMMPHLASAETPLVSYMGKYETERLRFSKERYNDMLEYSTKQRVTKSSRRREFVDTAPGPYEGLFQGLGEHGNHTDVLNQQRKQEYNDQLSQNPDAEYSLRNLPPSDNYQQILDEKRREEANRRRYNDPEYQDRLVQADNSTARNGF